MLNNKALNNRMVANWLFICCIAIFIMVVLGGLTRLTNSGLSIVKWEPLSGAIPPLSGEKWQEYFDAYKQIPEYQQENKSMTLPEFKGIFWLEYFHRLMGRAIGMIFLLPLIYFAVKERIRAKDTLKFMVIFALGGLQGFFGWYMVKSGFAERTDVSQYRLMLHLGMAFVLYGMIYWTGLDIKHSAERRRNIHPMAGFSVIVTIMIFFMVLLGALMAGTDAGFIYNTFPLMDGKLIPDNLYKLSPWWANYFENITMIQFQHRIFAMLLAVVIFVLAYNIVKRDFDYVGQAILLVFCVLIQIGLGISTLYAFGTYANYSYEGLAYHRVFNLPVVIAALHQANALVLFTLALNTSHKLMRESVSERMSYVI